MADVEQLLTQRLAARFDDARACTETPANLATLPRTVRVSRAGGGKHLVLDRPRIVLDCFAIATDQLSAREAARAWALSVDRFMEIELPHTALGDAEDDVFVTLVRVDSRPSWIPDANTTLRHFAGTYTLGVRSAA